MAFLRSHILLEKIWDGWWKCCKVVLNNKAYRYTNRNDNGSISKDGYNFSGNNNFVLHFHFKNPDVATFVGVCTKHTPSLAFYIYVVTHLTFFQEIASPLWHYFLYLTCPKQRLSHFKKNMFTLLKVSTSSVNVPVKHSVTCAVYV